MLCPDCKGPMKPLFTGFFCPNDCDRPKAQVKPDIPKPALATAGSNVKPANATYFPWGGLFGGWGAQNQSNYTPKTGQCPDAMCRAMGTPQYDAYQQNGAGVTTAQRHYKCNLCNKQFKEDLDVSTNPYPGMVP